MTFEGFGVGWVGGNEGGHGERRGRLMEENCIHWLVIELFLCAAIPFRMAFHSDSAEVLQDTVENLSLNMIYLKFLLVEIINNLII